MHRASIARRPQAALGDTVAWKQVYADPAEVYLFRGRLNGGLIESPEDARYLLRAFANAANGLDVDVRGLVRGPDGFSESTAIPDQTTFDIVFTADSLTPYLTPPSASDIAKAMNADPDLRARYPKGQVGWTGMMQLTGPPATVDFWRAHLTVWDDKAGPLDAFSKLQGIYKGGQADAGPALETWTSPPPVLKPKPTTSSWTTGVVVLVATAALVAGVALSKER